MTESTRLSEQRWEAVRRRTLRPHDSFLYAVRTTGIYCRPTCGARTPRRENVRFFEDARAAERAGFRACRRCRPDAPAPEVRTAALIARACRAIESAEQAPSLASLAGAAGLSPFHFHRVFKRVTGLAPKAYATALRAQRVRSTLPASASVTDAIYDAGFGSNGRFYAQSDAALGMTPTRYRAGGEGTEIRFAIARSTLGALLVAATARGVCAIELGDDPEALRSSLRRRFPRADLRPAEDGFERTVSAVIRCVESPASGLALPLDLQGTGFQLRVWQALRRIPPGRTVSYGELARELGMPRASRAVGAAVAANPVAVAVPCHRVIAGDGRLSGYRWGTERKRALLQREGRRE